MSRLPLSVENRIHKELVQREDVHKVRFVKPMFDRRRIRLAPKDISIVLVANV